MFIFLKINFLIKKISIIKPMLVSTVALEKVIPKISR